MVPRAVPTLVATAGIALVVAGVVMLTLAAPPQQVGGRADGGYVVTGPGVLALTGHPVRVEAVGEAGGAVTTGVYVGRAADVEAWLQGTARTLVTGVTEPEGLRTRSGPGDGDAPDPAQAGIWQQRATGAGAVLELEAPAADDVALVAAQGADVEWQRPARHPGAWPLVAGGALLAVLGAAWLVALNARRARLRARAARR